MSKSDDNARTGLVSIAAILPKSIASLTDEEWTERDALIAASKAKLQAFVDDDAVKARDVEIKAAGFPLRAIQSARVADEDKSAITLVKAWDSSEESILVVSGSHGCGKTVAATWWAIRQRFVPTFIRASTFAASSRYDRDARAPWFAASSLVLDDLGSEFLDSKGSFLVDLDELFDVFYGDRRPLLVTTNCTIDEFRARYKSRIVDRLRECGSFFSVDGGSMRVDLSRTT